MSPEITIAQIHKEFVPKYDRWHGKLFPRFKSWFSHIAEIIFLLLKGNRPYRKHGKSFESCRQHAKVEAGDWLWLTAEIFWMLTKIELPIVPDFTLRRVYDKLSEEKDRE